MPFLVSGVTNIVLTLASLSLVIFHVLGVSFGLPEKTLSINVSQPADLVACVLHSPWHIFHSMIPYLLVAVSFTNILNVRCKVACEVIATD